MTYINNNDKVYETELQIDILKDKMKELEMTLEALKLIEMINVYERSV